jgi:competence protein ComEC
MACRAANFGALILILRAAHARRSEELARSPRTDVFVAGDSRASAIRGRDGRLTLQTSGRDNFVVKEWLAADGDGWDAKDSTLYGGIACDAVGCIGRLTADDRRLLRLMSKLLPKIAPAPRCTLIDGKVWHAHGAMALRWNGCCFEDSFVRSPGSIRPRSRTVHMP